MIHIAACLWDVNKRSEKFSLCYDESWVEKLYRGFKRNLTVPFRFVLFTDRIRKFNEPIDQELLSTKEPHYGCLIEPFKLNVPMMIVGLDTVVVRNVDHFAHYCLTESRLALPNHPTKKDYGFINAVAFVPAGHRAIFDKWRGENDMEWLRRSDAVDASILWPRQLQSLKLHEVPLGNQPPEDARIIYMHGSRKPHELTNVQWIREHWR